jgi:hypothetical protein
MTLGAVTRGRIVAPLRVLVYGIEGIGKSTFAANAPSPIFLGAESGTGALDVARFPQPRSWADVIDAVQTLTRDDHEYKTLAVDSLDWVEPLVWAHVCDELRVKSIEEPGYGKGYVAALEQWRKLAVMLDTLRTKRGMHIVLIGHALVKPFKNPEGPDYDRYQIKLHEKAAGLFKEWVDELLFAREEVFVSKKKNERAKAVSGGRNIVHTKHTAAYDAKTRHGLPDGTLLSWEEVEQGCLNRANLEAAELADRQRNALATLDLVPEADRAKADAWLREAWGDSLRLYQRDMKLRAKYAPPVDDSSDGD